MKMTRRAALIGASVLATASMTTLTTTAFAADPIKVWTHGGKADGERGQLKTMIEAWNAANPTMPAVLEEQPEGAYNDQVQAAAASGSLPDLLDFDGPNYANYAWSGFIQPLDGLVSKEVLADMIPSLIAQGTYAPDGKIYGLGMGDSGLALWSRKSLLDKAGVRIPKGIDDAWTMAEFEDALAKLQKVEGITHALDVKLNYGQGEWYTYGFSPIVQSFGGDLIDRATWKADGSINGKAAVDAMTHFQGWIKAGYVVPKADGDDSFYGKKTSAISFVGHWMWGAHSKALGDDLILVPMPNWGGKHVTGNGGWCWGISKTSTQAENAGKLLNFLLSTKNVATLMNSAGGVPGVKSAAAEVALYKEGGPLNLYLAQLNGGMGYPRPAHPAYPTITASFAKAVADIVDGKPVQDSLDVAAKAIDQNIADNKGYPPFGKM